MEVQNETCCIEGEDVLLFPQEMKNCIPWKLIEIRFDQGRLLENPSCRHKKINLENLQDRWCIFYLLKHKTKKKIFDWLVYNVQSILVLIQICMLPVKVFRTRRPDTNENGWPRGTSLSECLCCSFFRVLHPEWLQGHWLRWSSFTGPASQTATVSLQISPTFSCHSKTRQQLALPGLENFLNFLRLP